MIFENVKKLFIPEGEVKRIECGGTVLWKSGYTNRVPLSIDTDGSIYNGGLGYKEGYRVRSGGAEAEYNSDCTGFIRVSGGDVVRLSGWNFGYGQNGNAINVSDASFANIGQFTMLQGQYGIFAGAYSAYGYSSVIEESEGVWKWVVPPDASGAAYIRITRYPGGDGSRMIVTINEAIE